MYYDGYNKKCIIRFVIIIINVFFGMKKKKIYDGNPSFLSPVRVNITYETDIRALVVYFSVHSLIFLFVLFHSRIEIHEYHYIVFTCVLFYFRILNNQTQFYKRIYLTY